MVKRWEPHESHWHCPDTRKPPSGSHILLQTQLDLTLPCNLLAQALNFPAEPQLMPKFNPKWPGKNPNITKFCSSFFPKGRTGYTWIEQTSFQTKMQGNGFILIFEGILRNFKSQTCANPVKQTVPKWQSKSWIIQDHAWVFQRIFQPFSFPGCQEERRNRSHPKYGGHPNQSPHLSLLLLLKLQQLFPPNSPRTAIPGQA